ncbi:hypothetical protein BC830DRAFT_1093334 [Chytriomyces sp. MP71]|nr:hypothetical protein BC830DRAFT_1093334 [Chytriomyces sp. MP71]
MPKENMHTLRAITLVTWWFRHLRVRPCHSQIPVQAVMFITVLTQQRLRSMKFASPICLASTCRTSIHRRTNSTRGRPPGVLNDTYSHRTIANSFFLILCLLFLGSSSSSSSCMVQRDRTRDTRRRPCPSDNPARASASHEHRWNHDSRRHGRCAGRVGGQKVRVGAMLIDVRNHNAPGHLSGFSTPIACEHRLMVVARAFPEELYVFVLG